MRAPTFTYDNRTGRPPGPAVRALRRLLPGAAQVWSTVDPLAEAWRAHNLEAVDRPGRRWFVLGDSLAQGVGASAFDTGWVGQLAARLAETPEEVNIVNLSATGARVSDVQCQQLPALELIGTRLGDLVTVMVGSNDLLGRRERRENLPTAFVELLGRLPAGSLVATLPNPSRSATRVNDRIQAAADAGTILMADLRVNGPTSWRGRLAGDFFHPNDAGHAAIATALEPAVRAALSPTNRAEDDPPPGPGSPPSPGEPRHTPAGLGPAETTPAPHVPGHPELLAPVPRPGRARGRRLVRHTRLW